MMCFSLAATSARARACGQNGAGAERFDINGDGTVTDIEAGLTWMRCSLGQSWEDGTCRGTPAALTWAQALERTASTNNTRGFAGRRNWRLPRLNELALLADRYCQLPRTDLTLFPGTPAAGFWSADPVPAGEQAIYILSFGTDGVSQGTVGERHYVRLVSGRDAAGNQSGL